MTDTTKPDARHVEEPLSKIINCLADLTKLHTLEKRGIDEDWIRREPVMQAVMVIRDASYALLAAKRELAEEVDARKAVFNKLARTVDQEGCAVGSDGYFKNWRAEQAETRALAAAAEVAKLNECAAERIAEAQKTIERYDAMEDRALAAQKALQEIEDMARSTCNTCSKDVGDWIDDVCDIADKARVALDAAAK